MPPPRRVVITGVGLLTPYGFGPGPLWSALEARRGAVAAVTAFDASALPVRVAAAVAPFDASAHFDRAHWKQLRASAAAVQFAAVAARAAFDDAGLGGAVEPERLGVVFGGGTMAGEPADLTEAASVSVDADGRPDLGRWGERGVRRVAPRWMLTHVPNMPASHAAILLDARGVCNTVTQTDAAGISALAEAYRAVRAGRADAVLTGGGDARVNPMTMMRHCLFAPLARPDGRPEAACRPFDARRGGTAVGEGAGVVVLEDLQTARRRGAAVYAEVVGVGTAFGPAGVGGAVAAALASAGVAARDVDHVNAQGYGTTEHDAREARCLADTLGDHGRQPTAFAAKGYFGNLGVAAGVVELSVSLLSLRRGVLPASLNHDEPAADCPLRVTREPTPVRRPYFVKVSCTLQGQAAAVVCRRWDD